MPTQQKIRDTEAEKRGSASRREILDAAARLFQKNGYGDTSLRELANAVGMKAGSLYYHFASKEQLAIEVLGTGVKGVAQAVSARLEDAGSGASPSQRVSIAIRAHLDAILNDSGYTSAHIRCFPYTPASVQTQLRAVRRDYARYLRLAVLGALNWSLEWFDPERDSAERFAATVERLVLGAPVPGRDH